MTPSSQEPLSRIALILFVLAGAVGACGGFWLLMRFPIATQRVCFLSTIGFVCWGAADTAKRLRGGENRRWLIVRLASLLGTLALLARAFSHPLLSVPR